MRHLAIASLALAALPSSALADNLSTTDVAVVRRWTLTPEVGISRFSYEEAETAGSKTFTGKADQTMLTAAIAGAYRFEESAWDIGGRVSSTVGAFGPRYSGTFMEGGAVRDSAENATGAFLVNGEAFMGYSIPAWFAGFDLRVTGGAMYRTMIVRDGIYGYSNLIGPEFYPELSRTFSNGHALSLFARYSPLFRHNDITIRPTGWEGTLGAAYRVSNASFGLGFCWFDMSLDKGSKLEASSHAFTASLAYRI
jgi:hypothetical protein